MAKLYYVTMFALLVLVHAFSSPTHAEPIGTKITLETQDKKWRTRVELPRKSAIDPTIAVLLTTRMEDRVRGDEMKVALTLPFASR